MAEPLIKKIKKTEEHYKNQRFSDNLNIIFQESQSRKLMRNTDERGFWIW